MHFTQTCEADAPHLLVEVVTTAATTPDGQILGDLHDQLAEQELLPEQHLVDMGSVDAEVLAQSHTRYQVDLVGPVPPESPLARPRQAKASITASLPLIGKPAR